MRFPDYVPLAVQQYITALLYGSGNESGWVAVAKEPGNEYIAEVVAFLHRFEKTDENIREMFRHLERAKLSEADQKKFMNAAWTSRTDFAKYRAAEKKAANLNQDIATKAEELAGLLDEIQWLGLSDLPMAFYNVRTLLHESDSRDDDLTMWRVKRHDLTGKSAGANADYAWRIAPSLANLLGTVAKAASNYEPRFHGRIGAAIELRQHNPKYEFIRAFWNMLDKAKIPATRPVLNAIACMTSVALADRDIIASYDDVRQALGLKKKASG